MNWTESVLEISIEYFQLRALFESSKLIITLPRTCLRRKKEKEGGKKEGIIKSSAFSWNSLIGKKPLTVEICIFLGYTRCNWKLNKNRFSLVCLPNPLISDRITPLLINQWEIPLKSPRYFSQKPKIQCSWIIEFARVHDSSSLTGYPFDPRVWTEDERISNSIRTDSFELDESRCNMKKIK